MPALFPERLGWGRPPGAADRPRLGHSGQSAGLEVGAAEGPYALTFRVAGQLCGLRFYEEYETRDVLPDPDAPGSGRRYNWQRVQAEARELPSGRLVMEFDEDWHLRGSASALRRPPTLEA
jgi:hypothetical protein